MDEHGIHTYMVPNKGGEKNGALNTKEAYGIGNDFLSFFFSYSEPKVKVDDVTDEKNEIQIRFRWWINFGMWKGKWSIFPRIYWFSSPSSDKTFSNYFVRISIESNSNRVNKNIGPHFIQSAIIIIKRQKMYGMRRIRFGHMSVTTKTFSR